MDRVTALLVNTLFLGGLLFFSFGCGSDVSAVKHINCVQEKELVMQQIQELKQELDSANPNPQLVASKLCFIEDVLEKMKKSESSGYFCCFLKFLVSYKERICSLPGCMAAYENMYSRVWYRKNIPFAPKLRPKSCTFFIDSYSIDDRSTGPIFAKQI